MKHASSSSTLTTATTLVSAVITTVAPLSMLLVAIVGCSSPVNPDDDGDLGSTEADLSSGGSCALSRDKILRSVQGGRRRAIERGFEWLDDDVPYNQQRQHNGYRTDCSGFVSMCWELGQSYNTAGFLAGDAKDTELDSYDDLQPADALVYRSGGNGHIALFLGWNDNNNNNNNKSHSSACVLEQASTASDMQFRAWSAASLKASGYRPVRADKLASEQPSPPAKDEVDGGGGGDGNSKSNSNSNSNDDGTSSSSAPGEGACYSTTLRVNVPKLACVWSSTDGAWEQCMDGLWYRGVEEDLGPFGPCARG